MSVCICPRRDSQRRAGKRSVGPADCRPVIAFKKVSEPAVGSSECLHSQAAKQKKDLIMNSITKRTITVAVSVAALAAAVSPSLAQTRHHRAPVQQVQEPYGTEVQPGMGRYAVPGYVHNPYECWSDEGNGRFSSCNNGSS
jgi:hypothetical protein